MTKPAITNRITKGSALTYEEQDANFTNLQNATWGVTDGTTSHDFNLNDRLTITGAGGLTVAVNGTTGAITLTGATNTNIAYENASVNTHYLWFSLGLNKTDIKQSTAVSWVPSSTTFGVSGNIATTGTTGYSGKLLGKTFPSTNGTSGQVLTSDGAGNVTWGAGFNGTLAANLNTSTYSIYSSTGSVKLEDTLQVGLTGSYEANINAVDGANLVFKTSNGAYTGSITMGNVNAEDTIISPYKSATAQGKLIIDGPIQLPQAASDSVFPVLGRGNIFYNTTTNKLNTRKHATGNWETVVSFDGGQPTTVEGFGITNAISKTDTSAQSMVSDLSLGSANLTAGSVTTGGISITNWTSVPQWFFRGRLTGSVSLTGSTDNLIDWSDRSDPGTWWDSVNKRVKPGRAGWYEVIYKVTFAGVSSSNQFNTQIRVNDTNDSIAVNSINTGQYTTVVNSGLFYLNSYLSYFTFTAYPQTAGQNIQGTAQGSSVSVRWISY